MFSILDNPYDKHQNTNKSQNLLLRDVNTTIVLVEICQSHPFLSSWCHKDSMIQEKFEVQQYETACGTQVFGISMQWECKAASPSRIKFFKSFLKRFYHLQFIFLAEFAISPVSSVSHIKKACQNLQNIEWWWNFITKNNSEWWGGGVCNL